MNNLKLRQATALLTAFSLLFSQFVQVAEAVTLASTPLANSTTSVVRPNIMYVLDDSGSMAWDYTPDYVNDTVSSSTYGMCWSVSGSGGTGGVPNDTNKAAQCTQATQVPYATAAVNYQFYDPTVYYQAPLKADGSAYANSTPTAAKADGFSASSTTTNLTTGWKHQVWCTTSSASPTVSDPTAGGKCVENSDTSGNHLYPDYTHVYLKTYNGAPYYFTMYPFEYCSDDDMTNCVAATAPTGSYTKPSLFRWCNSYTAASGGTAGTFNDCQGRRTTTGTKHTIPNYLGSWNPSGSAPVQAYANLQVLSAVSGRSITSLKIGGVEVLAFDGGGNILVGNGNTPSNPAAPGTDLGAPVNTAADIYSAITVGSSFPFSQGTANYTTAPYDAPSPPYIYNDYQPSTVSTVNNVATALCQAIRANSASSGYNCAEVTSGSDIVPIVANNVGAAPNGKLVVASGPAGTSADYAKASFTVTGATADYQATAITINTAPSQNLLGSPVIATGAVGTTAQKICQAIYDSPSSGSFEAISGTSSTYGSKATACLSDSASVTIRAAQTGTAMNTKTVTVTGPAVSTSYTGTITVGSVSTNWTKIDDITVGGTSILTAAQRATLKWKPASDNTQIAADIAAAINISAVGACNATATSSTNVVTIASALCSGAIAVTAATANTTGTLRVSSVTSCGSDAGCRQPNAATAAAQLGTSPTNGGIKVGSATIADNLTESGITNGTSVSTNAASIVTKINALTGTTGLTAGTPSCTGSGTSMTCDITVTTGSGNSAYNNASFTAQQGGYSSGSSGGTKPTWSFSVTGASSDNDVIQYLRCKTDSSTTRYIGGSQNGSSAASTGNTSSSYAANLASSLVAAKGGSVAWASCSSSSNTASCGFCMTTRNPPYNDNCTANPAWGASTSMSISSLDTDRCNPAASGSTGGGSGRYYEFDVDNADAANESITALTMSCNSGWPNYTPSTATLLATTATTGSSLISRTSQRMSNLRNGLNASGLSSYSTSCNAPDSTPNMACTVTGPSTGPTECDTADSFGGGGGGTCPAGSLTIRMDSSIDLNATSITHPDSTHDCIPLTSNGTSGGAAAYNDFSSAVTTNASFGEAYTAQSTSVSGMTSVSTGPITVAPDPATFAGGVDGTILTIATDATGIAPNTLEMTGGADAATANAWIKVGIFKRTDIISSVTAYARAAGRVDCADQYSCSYDEELQNFANWYTYYRTRMLTMKSASSIAFSQLDGKYRLGFDNICNATGTTVQLGVAQFSDDGESASQRSNWWTKLTTASPSCATPLRAETAKIGRYYAHKLNSSLTDPIQYSCQQNFMFLVTDGYWNEQDSTAMKKVDGTDIGNTDNDVSIAKRPFYDGQQASTTCPSLGSTRSSASSCRTLADIAWHYYSTDLRASALSNNTNATTGEDVSANNVPTTQDDLNTSQHMVFYGMGLGVDGTLKYRSDYQTAGVGDYAEIVAGTRNWPAAGNLDPTAVDDLWHATVNGHGKYFSARNPASVLAGLNEALVKIGARVGAAAAAATSNLEPVAGDNFAYVANYVTQEWYGDLQARDINLTTGAVSSTANWSAQTLLDSRDWSTREIFIAPSSNTSGEALRAFTYANLSAAEKTSVSPNSLSQYSGLSATNPTDITGDNLVSYLKGDRSLEQDGSSTHAQIWRKRSHVLGDIVDTQPVFVKKPGFYYTDTGYADYKSSGTAFNRKPVVYVSAQDGMLHAFNADTSNVTSAGGVSVPPGGELWAYAPKLSMEQMKNLGDVNYAHQYFVDGQISVGDVYFNNAWHTILVAGLGAGGKGYFALDITDPINPKFLWEISSDTTGFSGLGYTFGNPSINKLIISGVPTWAVLFTSGYNNADGLGHLYAVDAQTGAMLSGYPLDTTASNLGKLGVWATDPIQDNTGQFAYAGDLSGNLWRFDLNPTATLHTGTGNEVFKLASLTNAAGTAQPISTRPEATLLDDGTFVIYVGTGQYLGIPDLTTADVQSFYAIKDSFSTTTTWDPRNDTATIGGVPNSPRFLQRKLIGVMDNGVGLTKVVDGVTSSFRQMCSGASSQVSHVDNSCINQSGSSMDWAIYDGWFVDLPDTGERMSVDMNLSLGTLTFATNVPASNACTSGGYSWVNYLDYKTGLAVQNTGAQVSTKVSNALVVGINVVKLPNGTLTAIVTTSDNQQLGIAPSFSPTSFSGKRSLWREFEAY